MTAAVLLLVAQTTAAVPVERPPGVPVAREDSSYAAPRRRFMASLSAGATLGQLWSVTYSGATAELGLGADTPRLRVSAGPRLMRGRTRWGLETWNIGVGATVVWHRGRFYFGPGGTLGVWRLERITGAGETLASVSSTLRLAAGCDLVASRRRGALFLELTPAVELFAAAPSFNATLALGGRW